MDKEKLRASAEALQAILQRYAGKNHDVDVLHEMLTPLIRSACAGEIEQKVEWHDVPGDRPFLEGFYADFPDIENAYSEFKLIVTESEGLARPQ